MANLNIFVILIYININNMLSQKLKTALSLGGITAAVTFGLLLDAHHQLLNAEYRLLNDQFDTHKVITGQTIRDLRGQIANLKALVTGKNNSIEQLKNDLQNAPERVKHLERELSIERKISDILSSALTQERDRTKALAEEIKNLDETVDEFAEEITSIRQSYSKLNQEYQDALRAVFEIDKLNKDLIDITTKVNERAVALNSYLLWYERNSVQPQWDKCHIQMYKTTDEGDKDSADKPYMECNASWIQDGQKYEGLMTIESSSTEETDVTFQYLLKKYNEDNKRK